MPGAQERRMAAIKEGLLPARDEHIQGRLKDILPATKAILTNKTFMLNTWAFCCTTLIATGLGPFVSKFIQSQFGKSSSTAGLCVNVVYWPCPLKSTIRLKFILSRNRKVLGSTLCKGHLDFPSLPESNQTEENTFLQSRTSYLKFRVLGTFRAYIDTKAFLLSAT